MITYLFSSCVISIRSDPSYISRYVNIHVVFNDCTDFEFFD